MADQNQAAAPVAPSERLISIDVLRGFAVLGILIMNIQSFSMIGASYINPTAFGDFTGINKLIWVLSHLFADQKFMTIFSILFGAGIILITNKVETTGKRSAGLHYRRIFWLLIIGLIHAYIFWYGDILVAYAICGFIVYLARNLSPKTLLISGLLIVSIASALFLMSGFSMSYWPEASYQETLKSWQPTVEAIDKEIAAYAGSWLAQMDYRVPSAISMQTFLFLYMVIWRVMGLMFIGMALYKWKALQAKLSKKTYLIFLIIGFGLGFPIVGYGLMSNAAVDWSFDYSMFLGWQYNYWGSLFVSLGYISLIMLIVKSGSFSKLTGALAAVGRMALTNYLLHTLICTFIFYGHGFGLYGQVNRVMQILIMAVIWIFQLIASTLWLKYFRFGPAEWLWRSLTYLKFQPMHVRD